MRVYHFINKKYGLEDLRERRLKIARIAELNDPFEFAAVDLSDPWLRQAWEPMKQDMADRYGIICFSETWDSPVLWAHYADKHRGGSVWGSTFPTTNIWRRLNISKRECLPASSSNNAKLSIVISRHTWIAI